MKINTNVIVILFCLSSCTPEKNNVKEQLSDEEKKEKLEKVEQIMPEIRKPDIIESNYLQLIYNNSTIDNNYDYLCNYKVVNIGNKTVTSFLLFRYSIGEETIIRQKIKPKQSYSFKIKGCKFSGSDSSSPHGFISDMYRIIGVRFKDGQVVKIEP